jgi:hypothetical protein
MEAQPSPHFEPPSRAGEALSRGEKKHRVARDALPSRVADATMFRNFSVCTHCCCNSSSTPSPSMSSLQCHRCRDVFGKRPELLILGNQTCEHSLFHSSELPACSATIGPADQCSCCVTKMLRCCLISPGCIPHHISGACMPLSDILGVHVGHCSTLALGEEENWYFEWRPSPRPVPMPQL